MPVFRGDCVESVANHVAWTVTGIIHIPAPGHILHTTLEEG